MRQEARPSRTGETLKGKYRLDQLLGSGGMGEVYRARNTLVDRTVAIKVLHPHLVANKEVLGRFMREAKAANVVRHRNIVDVLDIDTDDHGTPFIVQEYLEGEDLGSKLMGETDLLPPDETLDLLLPVIDAVGEAHKKGVVHRDLKPDNVFLAQVEGQIVPKILDFGISKVGASDALDSIDLTSSGGNGAEGSKRLTAAGAAMGTPAYMSPEQIRDPRSVDARSDVWALGVMLYEVLSGRMPFDAEDLADLFAVIHTADAPALDRIAPGVPKWLARIVHRCLQPEPAARFADAAQLAETIRQRRPAQAPIEERVGGETPARRASAPSLDLGLDLDLEGAARGVGVPLRRSTGRPPASRAQPSKPPASSSSPPSSTSTPPASTSKPPPELELDLPSQPATSSRPPRSSVPPGASTAAAVSVFGFDEDSDDGGPGLKMELADGAPRSQSFRSQPPRSRGARAAATADRPPGSTRDIRVTRREATGPGPLTGALVRLLLAALLVVGLTFGGSWLSPDGVARTRAELGSLAFAPFAGATLISLVALVWVAAQAMRRVSLALFAASVGLLAVCGAAIATCGLLAAPGLVPATLRKSALIAGPWGALLAVVGLAAFSVLHGRHMRSEEERPLFGLLLVLTGVLALGAGAKLGLQMSLGISHVTQMSLVPFEARATQPLEQFAITLAGAEAIGVSARPSTSAAANEPQEKPPVDR